jgi:hypothetical protein
LKINDLRFKKKCNRPIFIKFYENGTKKVFDNQYVDY